MSSVPDNGPAINGGMWLMTILPLFAVLLRLFCKRKLGRIFGWDEYVLIFSWVLLLVYTACISGSVQLGIGKHSKDIPPQNVAPALELVYIGEFIAIIACSLAKTSFAITLLRTVESRWQKILLWFIIGSMNLIMWMCAIIYLAQCQPTAKLWDFTILEGHCWDPKYAANLAIAAGSYSGAMDFVLALLPWTIIWNLNINKKEKVGIGCAMSLGLFAGAVAIIKTTYLTNLVLVLDFTYYCSNVLIWAATETGVTIIAVCIPFFRTLLRSYSHGDSFRPSHGDANNYQLENKGQKSTGRRSKYWQMGSAKQADPSATEHDSNKSFVDDGTGQPMSPKMSKGAIQMTNEITITYEDAANVKDTQPNTPTGVRRQDTADMV